MESDGEEPIIEYCSDCKYCRKEFLVGSLYCKKFLSNIYDERTECECWVVRRGKAQCDMFSLKLKKVIFKKVIRFFGVGPKE